MVRVRVTAAPGARSTDLTRLYNWFRDDREVARDAEIALSGAATPGPMGTGEVIDMVVGHALTLTSIAVAYAGYRRGLPSSPPATFQVDSGPEVALPDDPAAAAKLLQDGTTDQADDKGE